MLADLKRMPGTPSLQLSGGIKSLIPLKIPTWELWDSPPSHQHFLRNETHQFNQNQRSAWKGNTREQPVPWQEARGHREEKGQAAKMQRERGEIIIRKQWIWNA